MAIERECALGFHGGFIYNKLFTRILDSSIWLEATPTRIVWITLLAAMDEDGYAHFAAIENLASRARVTVEEATKAIESFIAPDPNSSNPDNEGRRIERVPGGFMILNASLYRVLANKESQKAQTRARVALYRSKHQGKRKRSVTSPLPIVTPAYASASETASEGGDSKGNPLRIWDRKQIIEAKEELRKSLVNGFAYESPHGLEWNDPEKKKEYYQLGREIKQHRVAISQAGG